MRLLASSIAASGGTLSTITRVIMSVSTLPETTSAAAGVVGPGQPTGWPCFTVSTMIFPEGVFQYASSSGLAKSGTIWRNDPDMYFTKFSRAITHPMSALASFCDLPSVGTDQFITKVSARLRPAGPFGMTLIAVSFRSGCWVDSSWKRMLGPFGVKVILPAMKASLLVAPDHER